MNLVLAALWSEDLAEFQANYDGGTSGLKREERN